MQLFLNDLSNYRFGSPWFRIIFHYQLVSNWCQSLLPNYRVIIMFMALLKTVVTASIMLWCYQNLGLSPQYEDSYTVCMVVSWQYLLLKTSSGLPSLYKISDSQRNFEENMANFSVSTVPAEGLAPVGARTSAGTVMTSARSQYKDLLSQVWGFPC